MIPGLAPTISSVPVADDGSFEDCQAKRRPALQLALALAPVIATARQILRAVARINVKEVEELLPPLRHVPVCV